MNFFKRLARAASVAALSAVFCLSGLAQDDALSETTAAPTGLSVEINTKEGPTGYQSVPGHSFGGRYRRLPNWRPAEGASGPWTFEVEDFMEGAAVRVKVYALMDRFRERRELIGDYLLREGQKATVDALAGFGFEPMELAIVRVKRAPLVPPETATKAPSVLPISVQPRVSNFPSFKITLQNLSPKNISYLEIQTFRNGRLSTKEWKRGEQGRPIIKAGGTFDVVIFGGDSGQKDAEGYAPAPPQRVEIAAAVFDDRTYEGDTESAAGFAAHVRGQKVQIKRVLPLLAVSDPADPTAVLEEFKKQVTALGRQGGESYVEEIASEFPELRERAKPILKLQVEGGMNRVRKELLEDIEAYSKELARGGKPIGEWVAGLKRKYEEWLARL